MKWKNEQFEFYRDKELSVILLGGRYCYKKGDMGCGAEFFPTIGKHATIAR